MTFADVVKEDILAFFDEFAEPHMIDEIEINLIIDNNELLGRQKKEKVHDEGLYKKQVLFYVQEEKLKTLPEVGSVLLLDHEFYLVVDAIAEDGIFSIQLEANRD